MIHIDDRRGFTLVELLIVMVVIGILAAIALPKFAEAREKAFISSMESDLRNLASSQEIYHSEFVTYTDDLTELGAQVTQGVTVAIQDFTSTSWSALATHSSTDRTCAVFSGDDVAAVAPATMSGVVACDP